jgi:hypothetical protein
LRHVWAASSGGQVAVQEILDPAVVQPFDFHLRQPERFAVVAAAAGENHPVARPGLHEPAPVPDPLPVIPRVMGRHLVQGVAQQY